MDVRLKTIKPGGTMKTVEEVRTRLKLEIIHWFSRQCRDLNSDYYLYLFPQDFKRDTGLLICKETPKQPAILVEKLAKHLTIEQNFSKFNTLLNRLPCLDIQ